MLRRRAGATHVRLRAEEVEAVIVDGQDAGGRDNEVAAALDEEEGGPEHGRSTEEALRGWMGVLLCRSLYLVAASSAPLWLILVPSCSLPQPCLLLILTQELGSGLVRTERLHLLPVLADEVEPSRASRGVVELGRDVLLHLAPADRVRRGPEHPQLYSSCRQSTYDPQRLKAGHVIGGNTGALQEVQGK